MDSDFLLDFGSDLALRHHWFVAASFQHPAKLHLGLLSWLVEKYTLPGQTIADPMSGSGSILYAAALQRNVIAREVEPRWIDLIRANATSITEQAGLFCGHIDIGQADARQPWGYQCDHILCSPPYGNEINTTPNRSRALQYRLRESKINLGSRWQRQLEAPTNGSISMVSFHYGNHPAQIGHFRGKRYWQAMTDIYTQAHASLGLGYLILVLKDHVADGKRVQTADQTIALCERLGFVLVAHHQRKLAQLSFWQRQRKEAGLPVVEEEDILVFMAPS
jgi:predicted RNA methylase